MSGNKGEICSISQWGLGYEFPDHFVQSQWCYNKMAYLVYRIMILIFVVANFMGRLLLKEPENNAYFMIYLTNWGLVGFSVHQVIDLILILREYHQQSLEPGFQRK